MKRMNRKQVTYVAVRVITDGFYSGIVLLSRGHVIDLIGKGERIEVKGASVTWYR
jgi:hypothetical protein